MMFSLLQTRMAWRSSGSTLLRSRLNRTSSGLSRCNTVNEAGKKNWILRIRKVLTWTHIGSDDIRAALLEGFVQARADILKHGEIEKLLIDNSDIALALIKALSAEIKVSEEK
jgi:hypothetical protein